MFFINKITTAAILDFWIKDMSIYPPKKKDRLKNHAETITLINYIYNMYLDDLDGKAILFLSIEKQRPSWICEWNMGYIISKTQEMNFSPRNHSS